MGEEQRKSQKSNFAPILRKAIIVFTAFIQRLLITYLFKLFFLRLKSAALFSQV